MTKPLFGKILTPASVFFEVTGADMSAGQVQNRIHLDLPTQDSFFLCFHVYPL